VLLSRHDKANFTLHRDRPAVPTRDKSYKAQDGAYQNDPGTQQPEHCVGHEFRHRCAGEVFLKYGNGRSASSSRPGYHAKPAVDVLASLTAT